ncbi:MAG: TlpA family protein disulfide reductase [Bacteroidales bacterium]|nr:TlpA family protein disulfide reductase [Bacteroidales bacterium]
MKRLVLAITVLLMAVCRVGAQGLPDVSVSDAAGKSVRISSLADKRTPFILTMWNTACKPCLKELEALMDEVADWNEKFPLRIYAVSADDSRSLQRAVAMSAGWDGITPLFDTNGDLARALNVSVFPQVFIFDKEGKQVYTHIGYRPGDEQELLTRLRKCAGK